MVKIKDIPFCVKNLKQRQKHFDLPEGELEPQIFSRFSTNDLNFHGN